MKTILRKLCLYLFGASLIWTSLACGTFQVELVTPTAEMDAAPIVDPAAAAAGSAITTVPEPSPTVPPVDDSDLWTEYRDPKYDYGVALPAHWIVNPTLLDGYNGVMTTASYDEAYFFANSTKGWWNDGVAPEGAVKVDFVGIEDAPAGLTLAQAITDVLGRSEDTVVLSTEDASYGGHAAVRVETASVYHLDEVYTSVAFRLPSGTILLVAPYPSSALESADLLAILNSLVLSDAETVVLPTFAPYPPLTVMDAVDQTFQTLQAVAWVGHIIGMPDGSQYDDFVLLSPSGVGEYGVAGATPELEAELRYLRNAEGPDAYPRLWGSFTCGVVDYNNCQLLVERIQRGTGYTEENVEGWIGTILSSTFNGGTSHVFQLAGEVPMWYSIGASQDPALQTRIEQLRDGGAIVQVWGQLLVGVPDVNGTRIEPARLEVLVEGAAEQPALPQEIDLTEGWQIYLNDRYGYQFKYPQGATIEQIGPQSVLTAEIPEGMSVDLYMEQLSKVYTDQLCIGIRYSLGYIYISAPANAGARYTPCGRTGVGSAEIVAKTEEVLIGGRLYLAEGHEMIGTNETLAEHNETMHIQLEDGTRIEYGSQPSTEATYQDYWTETRAILLRIISTYQPTITKVFARTAADPGALLGTVACGAGFFGSLDQALEGLSGGPQIGNCAAIQPVTINSPVKSYQIYPFAKSRHCGYTETLCVPA